MNILKKALPYLGVILVTVLVIYLTPLKNLSIVEPKPRDIDPKVFYDKFVQNRDHYIFIDVRQPDAYAKLHAEGSINIPLQNMYDERHNLPKKGKEIVLICSLGKSSGIAFGYLEHYGFLNLWRIAGGIENWVSEGLPVVSGPSPYAKASVDAKQKPVSSLIIPCNTT